MFFGAAPANSCRNCRVPNTTGLIRITVHSNRHAAVTAEGAGEYLTKIDDNEMPMTPMTIIMNGFFSKNFIVFPHAFL